MTDGKLRRAPMLDGRLSAAMALAGAAETFADIGADHGRLSAVMLLTGGAEHGLVADVSAAALQKARARLHGLGLDERVTYAVADGLDAMDALGGRRADVVFILGMGGETLCRILRRGCGKLGGAALVLGAQTDLPLVRGTLCAVGYRIREERLAEAGGRSYLLMRCTPALLDEAAYSERECLLGPVLLKERPPAWIEALIRRARLLEHDIAAMRRGRRAKDAQRLALCERELDYIDQELGRTGGERSDEV